MAAASGQPQDISTAKKQVTLEQRKLFIGLGIMGALALVVGAMYLPGLLSGSKSTDAVAPVTSGTTSVSSPSGATSLSGAGGQVSPGIGTGSGSSGITATTTTPVTTQPVARFRRDPFQQVYFSPTPVPTLPPPPPLPTPQPPVILPNLADMNVAPLELPGVNGGSVALQRTLVLPPVAITRLDQGLRRPTEAFPPTRTLGGTGGGGSGVPSPSYDKRLSGVVIADGVRAILEIQGPSGPVSHVVQPGDEVEGITILNIQRFNDGTKTVTRMLIRENGEERTVELRAGVPQNSSGSGSSGSSGSSSSSGSSRSSSGSSRRSFPGGG